MLLSSGSTNHPPNPASFVGDGVGVGLGLGVGVGEAGGVASKTEMPGTVAGMELHAAVKVRTTATSVATLA